MVNGTCAAEEFQADWGDDDSAPAESALAETAEERYQRDLEQARAEIAQWKRDFIAKYIGRSALAEAALAEALPAQREEPGAASTDPLPQPKPLPQQPQAPVEVPVQASTPGGPCPALAGYTHVPEWNDGEPEDETPDSNEHHKYIVAVANWGSMRKQGEPSYAKNLFNLSATLALTMECTEGHVRQVEEPTLRWKPAEHRLAVTEPPQGFEEPPEGF